MTFKQFILRWLGIDKALDEQQAACEKSLAMQREQFITALTAQRDTYTAGLSALRAELESRSAVVLEASITASEKIARMVASQGDNNLKEYVDSCLVVFQEPVSETHELTH
jgi:hypothetical protein